jgi:predicted ATPase
MSQRAIPLALHPTHKVYLRVAALRVLTLRREADAVWREVDALMPDTTEDRYASARGWIRIYQGWAEVQAGRAKEGLVDLLAGIQELEQDGLRVMVPRYLGWVAEGYGVLGKVAEGLETIAAALDLAERTDQRVYSTELYQLKGELLRRRGADPEEVEECFRQAIAVAQKQEAKSLELRATTSLARLLREQGRRDEAREMLSSIYAWFTEGFDTPDLVEARALLEQLSADPGGSTEM